MYISIHRIIMFAKFMYVAGKQATQEKLHNIFCIVKFRPSSDQLNLRKHLLRKIPILK